MPMDNCGESMSQYCIDYPDTDDFSWTFFVNYGDRRVGRAHLLNKAGSVELCDILIYDETCNSSFLSKALNFLKGMKNCRSKGAGSFLLKECIAFCRANNANNHPPFVTPQPTPKVPVKKEPTYSLTRMIRDYLTEKKRIDAWTAKTTEENQAIYQLLKEILKNPAAETIRIKSAAQFKSALLQLPPNRTKGKYRGKSVKELLAMRPSKTVSVSTVNKYLRRVSSLFDWGHRHGYVHENPFVGLGIKDKRQAHEERARFSKTDISHLFSQKNLNHSTGKHSCCFWLPWVGLYTGARIEELCQLHLTDIRKESGIWVLDINDNKEKRLKTPASKRLIPVHPKLIEIIDHQVITFVVYILTYTDQGLSKQNRDY